jgi:cell wall-associated NlpC family hydrolase
MAFDVETCGANAVAWAQSRRGSTAYATRCLAFVEDAIERSNDLELFGGDDAAESAGLYDAAANTGAPPAYALAFYESVGELFGRRRDWGHVGLSLGDGRVVHAWAEVRIDRYDALEALTPAPGWEPLRWLGWVPLDRVLQGARPREWNEDPAAAAVRMQKERFGG